MGRRAYKIFARIDVVFSMLLPDSHDSNNTFLLHLSEDEQKFKLISKISVDSNVHTLHFLVLHDCVFQVA